MTGTNRFAAIFFEVRLSDSPRTGAFLVDGARMVLSRAALPALDLAGALRRDMRETVVSAFNQMIFVRCQRSSQSCLGEAQTREVNLNHLVRSGGDGIGKHLARTPEPEDVPAAVAG